MLARVLMASIVALAGVAHAQQPYPGKPIRILVPFTAGGTNDILGRLLSQKMTESTGQQVIVDNRPGGNTVIASQALLASAKDGSTLLLPGNSHVLVPYLSKAPLPFDSIKDFAPVASLARTGLFLVVNPAAGEQCSGFHCTRKIEARRSEQRGTGWIDQSIGD